MLDLESILLTNDFNSIEKTKVVAYMNSKHMLSLFQKAYELFETNLEIDFAKYIFTKSVLPVKDFTNYLLYKRFVTLLRKEINLGSINKQDHVLFIGSGPIPITAILMHQFSSARVDCGEKNSASADLSKKVINKLGYTDSINIINQEGVDIDCSQYSVILVALLAKPKDALLKSIWSKCKSNTRIICRTSDSIREAFYETTENSLFDKYSPKKKTNAKGDQTISSVLLIKP